MPVPSAPRALALAVTLAATMAPAAGARQYVLTPSERARLLVVDFLALDADGRPVPDLTAAEVSLRIDGRARPVRSLEFVAAPGAGKDIDAPFGTNLAHDESRAFLLVVEDETLSPGQEVALREEIRRFLATLGERDRVAILTVPYGGMRLGFTTNHARASVAVGEITGRAQATSDAGCRSRDTLTAIAGTLDSLRGEAPITTVLFSMRLNSPRAVESLSRSTVDGVGYFQPIGRCEVLREHYERVGEGAARARAQVYVVTPELSADNSGRAGLEHLTGVTGGPIWPLRGSQGALARVAVETAGHYIARIDPDPGESADTVRGFTVRVARPGVTVRQRPQLQLRPNASPVLPPVSAPIDMMRDARIYPDLPLRIGAATSRAADGQLSVLAMFDAPGQAGLASAMIGLFDDAGRLVASSTLPAAESPTGPVLAALAAPPGEYRLRVAAIAAQGPAGAADIAVSAHLGDAGPLKLSDLLLGLSRNRRFAPRLEFTDEPTAMAYLEVYGGTAGTPVGVTFELATTTNGPAFLSLPGAFAATSEPDKFTVTAAVPIGGLPPGDYVVRALVAAQDQPAGRAIRTLRKLAPR